MTAGPWSCPAGRRAPGDAGGRAARRRGRPVLRRSRRRADDRPAVLAVPQRFHRLVHQPSRPASPARPRWPSSAGPPRSPPSMAGPCRAAARGGGCCTRRRASPAGGQPIWARRSPGWTTQVTPGERQGCPARWRAPGRHRHRCRRTSRLTCEEGVNDEVEPAAGRREPRYLEGQRAAADARRPRPGRSAPGRCPGCGRAPPASVKLDELDVICVVLGCGIEELLLPEPGTVDQARRWGAAAASGRGPGGRRARGHAQATRRTLHAGVDKPGTILLPRRSPQLHRLPGLGGGAATSAVPGMPLVPRRSSGRARVHRVRPDAAGEEPVLPAVLGPAVRRSCLGRHHAPGGRRAGRGPA